MKTNKLNVQNLKVSAKMHLFIIISCVVIAIGLAVGTVCQFVANGFFNYAGDYGSYKSVTVDYESIDFSGNDKEPLAIIDEICLKAFSDNGVKHGLVASGDTLTGGKLTYKFSSSTDIDDLLKSAESINAEIKTVVSASGGIQFSYAAAHNGEAVLGGGLALTRAAIAVSCVIAVHFIYFAIRYRLTMALGALLADVHNLALYIALVALCRIPVGSTIATFAVLTVLLTAICTSFLFDKVRKNVKSEDGKKLNAYELTDLSVSQTFAVNTILPICLAALSVVLFVLLSISSLSVVTVLASVLCSIVAVASCVYGTVFFTASVYPRFKEIGDNAKEKSKAKKLAK